MIDLDEMVKRNQGKDFAPKTTSYAESHPVPIPHTLEEYNAIIAKIAPVETKVSKAPKSRHLPKRGLLLLLILAIAVIGSIVGIGALAPGTLPGTGPGTTTTQTYLTSWYVKDNQGNQWSLTNWNGPNWYGSAPSFTFNNSTSVTLTFSSEVSTMIVLAPPAVATGTPFTFQSRATYVISVVTSTNHQFSFSVSPP